MKATLGAFEVETNRDNDTITLRAAGSSISIPRLTLMELFEKVERDLGPTLQEYYDAGYDPTRYPPYGYEARPYSPELMKALKEAYDARRL